MTAIRRLAGQTAIYGIPSIIGRILGYLLVPLYTRIFAPGEYGTVNVFYSYASLLMVILTYGMETSFFRYNEKESDKEKVFSTGMISLFVTSVLFLSLVSVYAGGLARLIDYADHKEYVMWFGWILALDAISSIPFARLRALNKAKRFAAIKMAGIIINIGLNLFFILLCPYIFNHTDNKTLSGFISVVYRNDWGIEYIFISNLIASSVVLILLFPEIVTTKFKIYPDLWKKMIVYAFPLLFAGMAGIVNETFDRLLLRYLLPEDVASYQVGIYAACYKISILMTIFIQAYRYAKVTYARIMDYFIIIVSLIFLVTMVYLDDFILPVLVGKEYWSGRGVIPVLLLANLFLGVYYNLSIWYKLINKTMWGAWIAVIGAVITLILNFLWIPLSSEHLIYSYYGSAWATFICYFSMMVISFLAGQKFFPVRYNLLKFFGYIGLALLLYFISTIVVIEHSFMKFMFHTLLLLIYCSCALYVEKPAILKKLRLR
jgi:O-antigen/teichoic acid export membrane protein